MLSGPLILLFLFENKFYPHYESKKQFMVLRIRLSLSIKSI